MSTKKENKVLSFSSDLRVREDSLIRETLDGIVKEALELNGTEITKTEALKICLRFWNEAQQNKHLRKIIREENKKGRNCNIFLALKKLENL